MSYREIDVQQHWTAQCKTVGCKFIFGAKSAGEAEEKSREHIEDREVENYSHTVEIVQTTLVGRHL